MKEVLGTLDRILGAKKQGLPADLFRKSGRHAKKSKISNPSNRVTLHWRIQVGGGGCNGRAPPSNFLHFHAVLSKKSQIIGWRNHSGKAWIHHYSFYILYPIGKGAVVRRIGSQTQGLPQMGGLKKLIISKKVKRAISSELLKDD